MDYCMQGVCVCACVCVRGETNPRTGLSNIFALLVHYLSKGFKARLESFWKQLQLNHH